MAAQNSPGQLDDMIDCSDLMNDFRSVDLISIQFKSNESILDRALIIEAARFSVVPTMLE